MLDMTFTDRISYENIFKVVKLFDLQNLENYEKDAAKEPSEGNLDSSQDNEKDESLFDKINQCFEYLNTTNLGDVFNQGYVKYSYEDDNGIKNKVQFKYQLTKGYVFKKDVLILVFIDVSDQVEVTYQKELNERTNTMIACMTHELRTPLTCIIGMQECAIEVMGKDSPFIQEYIKPTNSCANYLLNQINNILDSSKMKFKTLKISKQKVCLREVCKSVLQLMDRKAQLKNLKMILNVKPGVPEFIISDKNRLT